MSRLLKRVGEALYGPRWQSEIARDLGVSDRTVRRWAAGTYEVPEGVYAELRRICRRRMDELFGLVDALSAPKDT